MKLIATALLTVTGCVALSGCPSKTVQEGAAVVDAGAGARCFAERDMLEKALEAYTLLQGAPPVDEAAMVPDWIRSESVLMDLDAAGQVIAAPGSGCA